MAERAGRARAIDLAMTDTAEVAYDELCGALAARDMQALWSIQALQEEPIPAARAWLWKWETVAALAKRAGEVVGLDQGGGERRALILVNPGLKGLSTTRTLSGALQYLGSGETAPAHRHTPAAIRFVLTGASVYTTVDGDACAMEPGDLVLTPSWSWHDHTNFGDDPMVWFDALDVPLVAALESVFFEPHPDGMQEVVGHNLSQRRFGQPGLWNGAQAVTARGHSPLMRYPWAPTDEALADLAARSPAPIVTVAYQNVATGGPAMPTMSCEMSRLRPASRTQPHRRTGSCINVVFRGTGRAIVDGTSFAWGPGDVFVVPSWSTYEYEALEPADIFTVSDRPVLEALHLHREETLVEPQEVRATFSPRLLTDTVPAGDASA